MNWRERKKREKYLEDTKEERSRRERSLREKALIRTEEFMKKQNESPVVVLKAEITKMSAEFGLVLPPGVSIVRFVRTLQSAVMANPTWTRIDKTSFFRAAMDAAKDGLLPDGKESAIVQIGNKATYIPMVAGIIKRIYSSERVKSLVCEIVYEKDQFEYEITPEGPHLFHKPVVFGDRGERIGVYAVAYLVSGGISCRVMPKEEIEKFKEEASSKSGPWHGPHESEMWKKTVLKSLSKRLPLDRPCNIEVGHEVVSPTTGEIIEEEAPAIEAPKEEK